MPDVVVGVDGSKHSLSALRMAAGEARARSGSLHIVYVYEPVSTRDVDAAAAVAAYGTSTPSETAGAVMRDAQRQSDQRRTEARRHAEGRLKQIVAGVDDDLQGLEVEQSAIGEEHPAAALVRLSQNADLLVVGSRGMGGFGGLLLGSVSQQCVNHAVCPVLVVRPKR